MKLEKKFSTVGSQLDSHLVTRRADQGYYMLRNVQKTGVPQHRLHQYDCYDNRNTVSKYPDRRFKYRPWSVAWRSRVTLLGSYSIYK